MENSDAAFEAPLTPYKCYAPALAKCSFGVSGPDTKSSAPEAFCELIFRYFGFVSSVAGSSKGRISGPFVRTWKISSPLTDRRAFTSGLLVLTGALEGTAWASEVQVFNLKCPAVRAVELRPSLWVWPVTVLRERTVTAALPLCSGARLSTSAPQRQHRESTGDRGAPVTEHRTLRNRHSGSSY